MSELHVYKIGDINWVCDWVIAYSEDDARAVQEDGLCASEKEVAQLDDDEKVVVMCQCGAVIPKGAKVEDIEEHEPDADFYDIRVTATARQWCDARGRGFLCSTEW